MVCERRGSHLRKMRRRGREDDLVSIPVAVRTGQRTSDRHTDRGDLGSPLAKQGHRGMATRAKTRGRQREARGGSRNHEWRHRIVPPPRNTARLLRRRRGTRKDCRRGGAEKKSAAGRRRGSASGSLLRSRAGRSRGVIRMQWPRAYGAIVQAIPHGAGPLPGRRLLPEWVRLPCLGTKKGGSP